MCYLCNRVDEQATEIEALQAQVEAERANGSLAYESGYQDGLEAGTVVTTAAQDGPPIAVYAGPETIVLPTGFTVEPGAVIRLVRV